MKKTVLVVMMGILFIAGNLFAAGDLYVDGNLGVGTTTPAAKLDVKGKTLITNTNVKRGFEVRAILDQDGILAWNFMIGADYLAKLTGSSTGNVFGMQATTVLENSALTAESMIGAIFQNRIGIYGDPDPSTQTTIEDVVGFKYLLNRHYRNSRVYNITNSYGVVSEIGGGTAFTPINVENHIHFFVDDPGTTNVIIDNLAGMWIEKSTAGTTNRGIVLDGDGSGADIVFGPSQETKLYGNAGDLMVDAATGKGLVIRSDSGNKCFRVTVNDAGALSSAEVTCP